MSNRASASYPSRSASVVTEGTLPAGSPQASTGAAGVGGGGREPIGVRDVRRDREWLGVALLGQREVHERAVLDAVHVREQAAVAIPRFDVAFEPDRRAR